MYALAFPMIDPVAISVGPFDIRWYSLAYIFGILFGWLFVRTFLLSPRYWNGSPPVAREDIDSFVTWLAAGIILGGRLGHVLFYDLVYFLNHPSEIFAFWNGGLRGMSFHGGFVGASIAIVLFSRKFKVHWMVMGDLVATVVPMGILCGRLANFINGELWGRVTTVPWAMVFPGAGPLPRHPSQLYEAILEGAVLLGLTLYFAVVRKALHRPGTQIILFCAGYGLARIVSEMFREPEALTDVLGGAITWGSLLTLILFAVAFFVHRRRPESIFSISSARHVP